MDSRFLLVDTSERYCSVALCAAPAEGENIQVLAQRTVDEARKHADVLLSLVQAVLDKCDQDPKELSAIGVVYGPGAFTGLRIGISLCQGLAYGWDLPCVPINTLELWGHHALRSRIDAAQVLVLMDARMKEVYAAAYRFASDGEIDLVVQPSCIAPNRLDLQWCDSGKPLILAGSGIQPYIHQIEAKAQTHGLTLDHMELLSHFVTFGRLVSNQFKRGEVVAPFELDALYLRPALQ